MKTLYYNGFIHTMLDEHAVYTCMGVNGSCIDYIGNEKPLGYSKQIDLNGRHVYPAMTDCHLHLLYSLVLSAGSFQVCRIEDASVVPDNLADVGERVRRRCKENPNQKIICGNGYIPSAIREKRLPTRQELDEWSGGRAIIIYSIDGHSSAMSSALMNS